MKNYTELCQFFSVKKIGEIRFAHAVNNQALLKKTIEDTSVKVLEGDISITKTKEIIMAHPPATASDLKFFDWLTRAVENRKGLKLDFKVPDVVEHCLVELKRAKTAEIPVFLNADVLQGPGGGPSPFNPEWFVRTCSESFPESVLSVGWKTKDTRGEQYTRSNVDEMLNLLTGWQSLVTFPIRACHVKSSWHNLMELLENSSYSLTLWNNEPVESDLLEWIKESIDPTRTFCDLINPDGSPLVI